MYTVPTKADIAANKGEPCPGGSFFPVRACQQFDCEAGTIKNGVYIGDFQAEGKRQHHQLQKGKW